MKMSIPMHSCFSSSLRTTFVVTLAVTVLCSTGVGSVRQKFETLARLAFEHGMRVNEQASCETPKPQLIYFKDPNKVYLPRATLIHRCSDLTGCCPHSTQTCTALETKSVDLYFYTIGLKSSSLDPRKVQQLQNIDRVTLTNHTRCGCRTGSDYHVTHHDNSLYEPGNIISTSDYFAAPKIQSEKHYHRYHWSAPSQVQRTARPVPTASAKRQVLPLSNAL